MLTGIPEAASSTHHSSYAGSRALEPAGLCLVEAAVLDGTGGQLVEQVARQPRQGGRAGLAYAARAQRIDVPGEGPLGLGVRR